MNIEEKVANYRPDADVRELIITTKIVLLVGISGAGKDTAKQQVLKSDVFHDIVSRTTRTPRQNRGVLEQDGREYHFISQDEAKQMLDNHEFVEAKFVHGTIYGTGVAEIRAIHDKGGIAITDIDVQGVDEYKKLSPDVIAVFLLPPNFQEWRRRLRERYSTEQEFETEWPKRFYSAIKELTHALSKPYYHFIINDDLHETVRIITEIATRPDIYNRKDDEARLAARDLLEEIRGITV